MVDEDELIAVTRSVCAADGAARDVSITQTELAQAFAVLAVLSMDEDGDEAWHH